MKRICPPEATGIATIWLDRETSSGRGPRPAGERIRAARPRAGWPWAYPPGKAAEAEADISGGRGSDGPAGLASAPRMDAEMSGGTVAQRRGPLERSSGERGNVRARPPWDGVSCRGTIGQDGRNLAIRWFWSGRGTVAFRDATSGLNGSGRRMHTKTCDEGAAIRAGRKRPAIQVRENLGRPPSPFVPGSSGNDPHARAKSRGGLAAEHLGISDPHAYEKRRRSAPTSPSSTATRRHPRKLQAGARMVMVPSGRGARNAAHRLPASQADSRGPWVGAARGQPTTPEMDASS